MRETTTVPPMVKELCFVPTFSSTSSSESAQSRSTSSRAEPGMMKRRPSAPPCTLSRRMARR